MYKRGYHKNLVAVLVIGLTTSGLILSVSTASTPVVSPEAESGMLTSCASTISDTSASSDQAIKFDNDCDDTPPLSLDVSGKTIPDTDYTIPAGAIFLATNGDDSNPGTQSQPVATLAQAIDLVPGGGLIPSDVANALGVPTTAGQTRGAFNWPGK